MSEVDEQTVRLVVLVIFGSTTLLLLAACLLLLAHCLRFRENRVITGIGTYCGHCGQRMSSDPDKAVAVADKGYFVYRCRACNNETLLPT
jgi:predicted SprT family Zn-dependent metalloprotease